MHRIPGGRIAALSLILAAALAGALALAADVEVGGLRVPDQLSEGGRALVLNGAGVRTKFVVKVYVAALYATARTSDAAALVNSAEPRRMRLHMLRDVDSKSLDGALQDGLRDNTPKQELEALKEPAQRLGPDGQRGLGQGRRRDRPGLRRQGRVGQRQRQGARTHRRSRLRPCPAAYGWAKTRRSPP